MIRHTEHPHQTVVADARGCFAVFGGMFVLSGLTALGLGASDASLPDYARLIVAAIGLAHIAGGLWAGWGESRTTIVDPDGVTITHRRLLHRTETRRVPAGIVDAVAVVTERDSDGDAVFAPHLRLITGERVRLTTQATPSHDAALAAVSAVARRLGRPEQVDWDVTDP